MTSFVHRRDNTENLLFYICWETTFSGIEMTLKYRTLLRQSLNASQRTPLLTCDERHVCMDISPARLSV